MGMTIIKDYGMPHNCYDCDLHNYHECDLTGESIEEDYCWNGDSREKHCPLREVEAIEALDQEPTTKNDLGVDCISREQAINAVNMCSNSETILNLQQLPSITPQEPQTFKWCTDCREYDQEKHCCHRWSKVIRDTVEEMKQEQEPMVEIDLYSVIKQKYIERELLDKIRAEIENDWQLKKYPSSPFSCGLRHAIEIIDKYKIDKEQEDGND